MTRLRPLCLATLLLGACSVKDSHTAHEAQSRLMGMSEVDLESCLGAPDQSKTFGNTDILTYYATSTSTDNFSVPLVGGIGFGNGGYCHATFQVKGGHVTQILYSGEKNATGAPDAYCAPITRTCLDHLNQTHPAVSATATSPSAPPSATQTPMQQGGAAPQPSQAPASTPTATGSASTTTPSGGAASPSAAALPPTAAVASAP